MKKRLLMLSTELSGINKFLFQALKNLGWELIIEDVPVPLVCRWASMALSFHPHMQTWKRRFETCYMKVSKMDWVFVMRTKRAQKAVQKHAGKFDLIFQISSLFAPYLHLSSNGGRPQGNKDYLLWIDYTTSLSKDHPGWAPFKSELAQRLSREKMVYTNARMIFTTSENTRRSLIGHYGVAPERVVTTGNGLNLEELSVFDKKYDCKTLLFIGMDFERKGGFVLLEAFQKVREAIPEAKLVIIGPNKNIHRLEGPGIEFLGHISERQIVKNYYQDASLFVMPSFFEPFGLVFLEAMAYKVPCIGADKDAMPEIIREGKTGFLVPPGDSRMLAERIIFLLKNEPVLRQLGENGHQFVKENFLWGKVVGRIEQALKGIV